MSSENESITSEDREECLEALCRLEQAHHSSTAADLAAEQDLAGRRLADLLLDLVMSGDVTTEGASFSLTRKRPSDRAGASCVGTSWLSGCCACWDCGRTPPTGRHASWNTS